jgi:GxxExxY protein
VLKKEILYGEEAYRIIGDCFEVYKQKGCGFVEPVYQESLEIEMELQGIPFHAQRLLPLEYKGRPLKAKYVADFVCFDRIIVELKAVSVLIDEHRAQVQNYLKATGHKLGLLVNFGHYPKVEYERVVTGKGRYECSPTRSSISASGEILASKMN